MDNALNLCCRLLLRCLAVCLAINPVNATGIKNRRIYVSADALRLIKDAPFHKLGNQHYPLFGGILPDHRSFPFVDLSHRPKGTPPIEFGHDRMMTHYFEFPRKERLTGALYGRNGTIDLNIGIHSGDVSNAIFSNKDSLNNAVSPAVSVRGDFQDELRVCLHEVKKVFLRKRHPFMGYRGDGSVINAERFSGSHLEGLNGNIMRVPHQSSFLGHNIPMPQSSRGKNNFVVKCGNLTVVVSVRTVCTLSATVGRYDDFVFSYINNNSSPPFGLHLGPCSQVDTKEENREDRNLVGFHIILKDSSASFARLSDNSRLLTVTNDEVYLSWDEKSWYLLI